MERNESIQGVYEFRCKNCGAPLDVSPETIVAICSYCGYPNWIREDLKEELYIVEALSEKKIIEKALERARKDPDLKRIVSKISFGRPIQVYIPYYFAEAVAEADYEGKVVVYARKCSGSGKNRRCWTTSRIVHVSGHYGPYRAELPVIGRRGVRAFSARVLGRHYLSVKHEAKPLSSVKLERAETRRILTVEIDKETAETIALNEHLDDMRNRIVDEMKKKGERKAGWSGTIIGSRVIWKRIRVENVDVKLSPITLLPLYVVPYTYKGGTYRFFMSGWDGETIVAEEPMNIHTKIAWGTLGTLAAGVMGGTASLLFIAGGKEGLFLGSLLFAIGGAVSYYSMKMATRPVRVEVVGEKFKSMKELGRKVGKILSKINRFAETTDIDVILGGKI